MLIRRRKKKEKQGGRKGKEGKRGRETGDLRMNDSKPSRSLQSVKGNIVAELERVLQEATAH